MMNKLIKCPVCGTQIEVLVEKASENVKTTKLVAPSSHLLSSCCVRLIKWHAYLSSAWFSAHSIIPARMVLELERDFKDARERAAELALGIVNQGKSVFIYGPVGTGKSVLASYILEEYAKLNYTKKNILAEPENLKFIPVVSLLLELKAAFTKNSAVSEKAIMDNYVKADLLVIDDFGLDKTTDWAYQSLYYLINSRYDAMKPVIITSNFSLDELADKMGDDRIISRIYSMIAGNLIEFQDIDRRLSQ